MSPVPMTPTSGNIILEAAEGHRDELEAFLYQHLPIHRHLDWYTPLDLIGQRPFLIEYRDQIIQSVLCATPENHKAAWIRTFAVRETLNIEANWKALLPRAIEVLGDLGIHRLAALGLQSGFEVLLIDAGFKNRQNIILLEWNKTFPDPDDYLQDLLVQPMHLDDLEAVAAIDRLAFDPLWQNSLPGLTRAFYQNSVCTVAKQEGTIVGYQISTITTANGHLARLAVHPDHRRQGIADALVRDLLGQFEQLGLMHVTVNTQSDNLPSLHLYQKLGFTRTHKDIRVYELLL